MDYSKFDWSGGDIGDIEPYQLPKGSTAAGLGDMTSSIVSKLGSGIVGGLANTGAGVLSGLAGATPYGAIANVVGSAIKDAPLTQTAESGRISTSFNTAKYINMGSGTMNATQNANQKAGGETFGTSAPSGGPNYWLYGGMALAGLIAIKIMKG